MGLNKRLLVSGEEEFVATSNFSPFKYTGDNTNDRGIDIGFQPDLVWIKCRTTSHIHMLYDSVRGASGSGGDHLSSDLTSVAGGQSPNLFDSFDADGFTIDKDSSGRLNNSGDDYISWCFKGGGNSNTFNVDGTGYSTASAAGLTAGGINPTGASVNTAAGFSVIRYAGTATSTSVEHGLDSTPEFVIFKAIDDVEDWFVYYKNSSNYYVKLNATAQGGASSAVIPSAPTSTVVNIGSGNSINQSGKNYIMYSFTSITGYQKIDTFSYPGSVNVGFQPRFVIFKKVSASGSWYMVDSERGGGKGIFANNNLVEDTSLSYLSLTSTGFTTTFSDSGTYLYLAIA